MPRYETLAAMVPTFHRVSLGPAERWDRSERRLDEGEALLAEAHLYFTRF